jgi:hypothetical protein
MVPPFQGPTFPAIWRIGYLPPTRLFQSSDLLQCIVVCRHGGGIDAPECDNRGDQCQVLVFRREPLETAIKPVEEALEKQARENMAVMVVIPTDRARDK